MTSLEPRLPVCLGSMLAMVIAVGATACGDTVASPCGDAGGHSPDEPRDASSPLDAGPVEADAGARDDAGRADAAGSPAEPRLIVGVTSYRDQDFARLSAAGIHFVRLDRPSAERILLARSHGVEVLPIAAYGYADLTSTNNARNPPDPLNYGAWARRTVDIWRDMAEPPGVIEVWNEPWLAGFWGGDPDAVEYLALFKAFAAEAWSVWPEVTLLVSADSRDGFIDDLLAADSAGFLNDPRILPTVHPYTEARPPSQRMGDRRAHCNWDLTRYECAYQDFLAHGHPDPQVWVTEFGWESDTPSPGFAHNATISEAQQAAYVVESLQTFLDSGIVAAAFGYMMTADDPWNYNWVDPANENKPVVARVSAFIADHDLP